MQPSDYWFSRREVREVTGWSQTQLRVHLGRLQELEYILPHRGMRGQSYVYELVYDGEGSDGDAFLMGLIDVDALRNDDGTSGAPCGYDGKLAGVDPDMAGSKRPQNGAMAGAWRGRTSCENASPDRSAQPVAPETAPDAYPGGSKPPASYTNGHIGIV